jgi:hypothetical protein
MTAALHRLSRTTLSLLAAGVLLTNGCVPPHAVPYARLSPAQYCPGDTLTASYDTQGGQACVSRPGADCADNTPAITLTSTSPALPTETIRAFAASRDVVPSGGDIEVTFTPDRRDLVYPALDRMGNPVWAWRYLIPYSYRSEAIVGEVSQTLMHGGMCSNQPGTPPMPVHGAAEIPGAPTLSPSLRLRRVCNENAFPVEVTVTAPSGESVIRLLEPLGAPDSSRCITRSEPGVPAALAFARIVGIRNPANDPTVQCADPTRPLMPPAPLRTSAHLGCGD